jgi:gas vesicle protein
MDNPEVIEKIKTYEEQISLLKTELNNTKEHLHKYTNNTRRYYNSHKEEIKKKVKEYKERTNYIVAKDVIKERNKRAYQKRKEKEEIEKTESI